MRTANIQIVNNRLLNASFNSVATEVKMIFGYSIQAVITGTPTGTVKLQASSDPATEYQPTPVPTNWTDIADSMFTVTAAGNMMWNVSDVGYSWVRLVYTDTSSGASTAHMTAILNLKGI